MNILITPDNNVVIPTCVMLHSIRHSTPDERITIHLMHYELYDESLKTIQDECDKLNFELLTYKYNDINIEILYKAMPQGDLTHSALLRCFLADTLPKNLNRVLYLDIDLVVVASLSELYHMDLNGKIAGVVGDCKDQSYEDYEHIEDMPFNSGVMLIDLEKWRSNSVTKEVTKYMMQNPEMCNFHDQTALNVVIKGKVKYLHPKWNVMRQTRDYHNHRELAIIHYAGTTKPWIDPTVSPHGIFYCNFSKYTPWPTAYVKPKFSLAKVNWKKKQRILKRSVSKRLSFH